MKLYNRIINWIKEKWGNSINAIRRARGKEKKVPEPDTDKLKEIAQDNCRKFNELGISLYAKRILDIGFGYGFNSNIFRKAGADVYGCEPSKEEFEYAISHQLIEKSKAFNTVLQEMAKELFGTFDIATILLYNIPFSERETVMKLVAKSIKPTGTIIISLIDDIYKYGDQYYESIYSLVSRYFHNVERNEAKYYRHWDSEFIIARDPRLLVKEGSVNWVPNRTRMVAPNLCKIKKEIPRRSIQQKEKDIEEK